MKKVYIDISFKTNQRLCKEVKEMCETTKTGSICFTKPIQFTINKIKYYAFSANKYGYIRVSESNVLTSDTKIVYLHEITRPQLLKLIKAINNQI